MFATAVSMLFLIKPRWPKKKNIYDSLLFSTLPPNFPFDLK